MKNLLITFLLTCMASFGMLAQDLSFGAKAGINFSNWSTNADDTGGKVGFLIGAFGQYPIQDNLFAQAELLFSNTGVTSTDDDNPGHSNLNYISIPLLAGYQITPEISAHAGFQPSFLLSAKTKYTDIDATDDIKDEISGFDLAFFFGGEYMVQEGINAGLRIALGLTDIIEDNFGEAKNVLVQIYGTYQFPSN